MKFIVLHRSLVETIASHPGFDGGHPEGHLNVVAGYMLLIRQFLDELPPDAWALVCMKHLTDKYHDEVDGTARQEVISRIAHFLGYPNDTCEDCFDGWRDTKKVHPPEEDLIRIARHLGDYNIMEKIDAVAKELGGIWPPPVNNGPQCELY